jgi:hypothetical protein
MNKSLLIKNINTDIGELKAVVESDDTVKYELCANSETIIELSDGTEISIESDYHGRIRIKTKGE